MKTKKVYVVEHWPYHTRTLSAITISKVYAKKHTAEVNFSEDYLESLRINDTTRKIASNGDVLDMYCYEDLSGCTHYVRLREVPMITD